MDESQSSDFFSDKTDMSINNSMIVDGVPYETLISNTKSALRSGCRKELKKSTFSNYFTLLLEDCHSCISQALDLIISVLSDTDIQISKLIEYMNDAVSVLQMLSDFIKMVIESISMACQSMRTFPTTTCDIILKIFVHCKESEELYGPYLSNVEKELKDLFRSCHELQLTYLMILEKHFVFDLTETDDVEVLVDALDINLKVGDVVQTLDVKTMAEQWKAFTAICEKYSNAVMDKTVYNNSINILSEMIEHNIKTPLQGNQEDKIVLRSLKVASFSIKILLKICGIFKHSTSKNHERMFELLLYIYSNISAILEVESDKPQQVCNLMNVNVSNPIELLLKELLNDVKFANYLLDCDVHKLKIENMLIGFNLIVISVMKSILHRREDSQHLQKTKIIKAVYTLLPHCHTCMNIGLKFPTELKSHYETQGLFEHFLSIFVAFVTTFTIEEYAVLEKYMMDAILGTDCMTALFSSNAWILLARRTSPQLAINQLICLCKIYQKLEGNNMFLYSPQKVHLSNTIRGIFEAMPKEDKVKISKLFNLSDDKNHDLWCALQINKFPESVQIEFENFVVETLKTQFKKICTVTDSGEIEKLIKIINLAGTCNIRNFNLVDCVLKAWEKACPKSISVTISELNRNTLWYFNYVSALVSLTQAVDNVYCLQGAQLVKVLHVVAEIVKKGNTEQKLILIDIVCKLATLDIHDDKKNTVESHLVHVLKCLSRDTRSCVKLELFSTLREYKDNKNLHRVIQAIINEDYSSKDLWGSFMKYGVLNRNNNWRGQILDVKEFKYRHKCLEAIDIPEESSSGTMKKTCSGNFEFTDIDTLFENESDCEQPVHKKAKLNNNEADVIITRLENDVCLLFKTRGKVTSDQKTKIRSICDQLKNICD